MMIASCPPLRTLFLHRHSRFLRHFLTHEKEEKRVDSTGPLCCLQKLNDGRGFLVSSPQRFVVVGNHYRATYFLCKFLSLELRLT